MAHTCKQISIEKPTVPLKDMVFIYDIPIPEIPPTGARIRVVYAGICYKQCDGEALRSPPVPGIRDTSLFPGFEVAGTVESLGYNVPSNCDLKIGDRVIIYPYQQLPALKAGYAEYISVPDVMYLVKIPRNLLFSVAAMLPSGALWAMNAVNILDCLRKQLNETSKLKVLIIGTGGLALWTLQIASHILGNTDDVLLTIAALKDTCIDMAQKHGKCNVVSWDESVYEVHLLDRTKCSCDGEVDICLDYSATPTRISRAIKCLRKNGIILVGPDCGYLEAEFRKELATKNVKLHTIPNGSLAQLKELVNLVAGGKVNPPKYCVFPLGNLPDVMQEISRGNVEGRAVLEFIKKD